MLQSRLVLAVHLVKITIVLICISIGKQLTAEPYRHVICTYFYKIVSFSIEFLYSLQFVIRVYDFYVFNIGSKNVNNERFHLPIFYINNKNHIKILLLHDFYYNSAQSRRASCDQ